MGVNTLPPTPPSSESEIPIKKPITSSPSEIASRKPEPNTLFPEITSCKPEPNTLFPEITSCKPEPNTLLPDRLSNLSDDILLHILACLNDTKYAVQTSVLSKGWRHLWTSVEELYFHRESFYRDSSFHNFVRAVLTDRRRQNCRVDRFRYYADLDTTMLTEVTSYALSRGARELVIAYPSYHGGAILPDLSSGSPTLKTLHLGKLYIRRSSFGHSMLRLTSLHLEWVQATPGCFGECFDIFNIFPNLTNLSLSGCSLGGANLKITGPKLVSFKLHHLIGVGLIELSLQNLEVFEYTSAYMEALVFSSINLPSLRHADLDVNLGRLPKYGHSMVKVLQGIRNVESLVINLKALEESGLLENQNSRFRNLKYLKFRDMFPRRVVPATVFTYFTSGTQYSQDLEFEFML
ncbi:hypothetical protein Tsubulata_023068 [Turnera subulata]|uniref:F-box domain-containing protein n=1 Tax=Turnera subulata TaxID=218843 RepID=A0A9Q0G0G2_9ROSI|nr:hypothetical protein Tsubulata_023068 [Turnera subulata]